MRWTEAQRGVRMIKFLDILGLTRRRSSANWRRPPIRESPTRYFLYPSTRPSPQVLFRAALSSWPELRVCDCHSDDHFSPTRT
jgi:hypothetical protein